MKGAHFNIVEDTLKQALLYGVNALSFLQEVFLVSAAELSYKEFSSDFLLY